MSPGACRVMVLGPPLSGKTSHCQALSGSLGLPLIQVGPLLQARAAAVDALHKVLQEDGLVPNSMYLEALGERLQQQDCIEAGWLIDGFPHTLAQVQHAPAPFPHTCCFPAHVDQFIMTAAAQTR